jgi:hypothetical protein
MVLTIMPANSETTPNRAKGTGVSPTRGGNNDHSQKRAIAQQKYEINLKASRLRSANSFRMSGKDCFFMYTFSFVQAW